MKFSSPSFAGIVHHELFRPVCALTFASTIACVLLGAYVVLTGSWWQLYLPWNLFLAWSPLLFAWLATCADRASPRRKWHFRAYTLAWLLLFPNAPYILTDLWHLPPNWQSRFWVEFVLILLFALTGLVLGFLSLSQMQTLVARRFGWVRGWLFVWGVAAFGGFGMCIGRFLRWNSWDAMLNPGKLLADLWWSVFQLSDAPRLLAVPVLFATLIFVAHVLLYALARMSSASGKETLSALPP